MIGSILKIISAILGLFGFGKSDPVADERKAATQAGEAIAGEANAIAGLKELDKANKAREDAAAELAAHPDSVRRPDGDMAKPDATGIS